MRSGNGNRPFCLWCRYDDYMIESLITSRCGHLQSTPAPRCVTPTSAHVAADAASSTVKTFSCPPTPAWTTATRVCGALTGAPSGQPRPPASPSRRQASRQDQTRLRVWTYFSCWLKMFEHLHIFRHAIRCANVTETHCRLRLSSSRAADHTGQQLVASMICQKLCPPPRSTSNEPETTL